MMLRKRRLLLDMAIFVCSISGRVDESILFPFLGESFFPELCDDNILCFVEMR